MCTATSGRCRSRLRAARPARMCIVSPESGKSRAGKGRAATPNAAPSASTRSDSCRRTASALARSPVTRGAPVRAASVAMRRDGDASATITSSSCRARSDKSKRTGAMTPGSPSDRTSLTSGCRATSGASAASVRTPIHAEGWPSRRARSSGSVQTRPAAESVRATRKRGRPSPKLTFDARAPKGANTPARRAAPPAAHAPGRTAC